ncbi:fluoride efflux transporter FluC [Nocardioides zeae]|uniref:Fluoride-specific ion channel FluC n=1 Tax=Nocardioides zeae TaxID=1457234 RepID=A0AAJ1U2B5_9ACTN|nr:CrcB family protein [Nocardioides zeae]MDQ1104193.1 CrcB protein [Nocardioides zeae]
MSALDPGVVAGVAVAGGVGAAVRYGVDTAARRAVPGYPLGTLVINVSGAFLLGLVTGLLVSDHLGTALATVLGAGLLGGYTTFSTASVEAVVLLEGRRWSAAALHAGGMLLLGVVAAGAGWWLGT